MNENLNLIRPSVAHEKEFMDTAREWDASGANDAPWYTRPEPDFLSMLTRLEGFSRGVGLPEGFVPSSTFWLAEGGKRVLGAINVRHRLNEFLLNFGGQVGYAIRPSERNKGYGKEILRLGLIEAKALRLEKVLVCCMKENAASERIIEVNGGVLEDEREFVEGKVVLRYWISIPGI